MMKIGLPGKRRSNNLSEMFLISGGPDPPEDPPPTTPGFGWLWPAVVGVLTVVVVGLACGVSIYALNKDRGGAADADSLSLDALYLLNLSDATNLRWTNIHDVSVTSLQRLMTSKTGVMMALEVTSEVTSDNMTEPLVVVVNQTLPLREVLKVAESCSGVAASCSSRAGVELAVDGVLTAHAALSLLHFYTATHRLRMPVWVRADVIGGSGWTSPYQGVRELTDVIQTELPQATLSLGPAGGCGNSSVYTPSDIEALWTLLHPMTMPVSLRVCLSRLGRTWPLLQWWLDKDPARFSLTVSSGCGETIKEGSGGDGLLDLLLVRNDLPRRRLFLDVADDIWAKFKTLDRTAGMPVNLFPVPGNDAAFVRWSRAANTRKTLLDGLDGHVMLQGDVSSDVNGTLWMGRSPSDVRDVTLHQWLGTASNADVGVKIHIRSDDVITPTLRFLSRAVTSGRLSRPLWVQADVYEGQGSEDTLLNRRAFRAQVTSRMPRDVTVCLGWAVGRHPGPYTRDMLSRMLQYARPFTNQVVFAVRAGAARASWPLLMTTLQSERRYKLLVWADEVGEVDIRDLVYIHRKSEVHRVYYSLPGLLHDDFLRALRKD